MKSALDPVSFRQSVLQLLEAAPPREEAFLEEVEALRKDGQPVFSHILFILTHLSFSEAEARKHWEKIQAQRARLRFELGRDVGLRVALLDYFVNLNQALKNPKVIELAIYERTERSAISDGLTGLYNHAHFLQSLRRELNRSKRHAHPLSLVLLDLDNFKKLNDTRGHLEGDRVLMKTGVAVRETLRDMDVAARYGGEEFAVILPETPRMGAYVVAERIRHLVEDRFKRSRKMVRVTLSGGVATHPDDATSVDELIEKADQGLYRSKAGGKNRITLVSGERRQHLRVPVNYRVTLGGLAARKIAARTRNVSESGLLLSLRRPLPIGGNYDLLVQPLHGRAVGLSGEVVRVESSDPERASYHVGVRFRGAHAGSLALMGRPGQA